ncbi:hypothetical protein H6M51_19805 [Rhizobium sp. AQ_MP]|uniref:hypothetical protein n=1 Tax=Rhizobium sp. AQ_MP TaxID=2761536 RepID=UPI00163B28DA|nr:hypothetical protein [Rhizobium sp. AQ_MP]MBC2775109.1 hypothetical protein [Rhizobium sp. AQ_MP]
MSLISAHTRVDLNSEGAMPSWGVLAQALYGNPKMVSVAHWFAQVFIAEQPHRARSTSIFTTQQRWLLAHLAASLYCLEATGRGGRLSLQTYVKAAVQHRIASRNTARDFFLEIMKYDFSSSEAGIPYCADMALATVPAHPSQRTRENMQMWYELHLTGLDMIDGKGRIGIFEEDPLGYMMIMQPLITEALLTCPEVRMPGRAYALFSWVDEGGLLMDRLIAAIHPTVGFGEKTVPIDVVSVAELARGLNLSRVHAARVIRRAEEIGAVGWTGSRGRATMWVSRELREEYIYFQALKMVIVDFALSAAVDLRPFISG